MGGKEYVHEFPYQRWLAARHVQKKKIHKREIARLRKRVRPAKKRATLLGRVLRFFS